MRASASTNRDASPGPGVVELPDHPPVSYLGHRGRTQSIYYRDSRGLEPVNNWLEALLTTKPAAVAKIDQFLDEHINGHRADSPPPEFPITAQVEGGLRELRVRFANTRYRLLYQRSGNLVVLLHGFEKNTGEIPPADKQIAQQRFADFRARMDAEPRVRPRAAGHDAPSRRGLER
jgi:phage-related protein